VITHWKQGRTEIETMVKAGYLQKVSPDRELAELFLEHARLHLHTATQVQSTDPTGSFQIAYDAARKSCAALLENQGLRATSKGGHRAVEDALRAQLVPPLKSQLNNFGWMRTLRNASEYPSFDNPTADASDAHTAITYAKELLGLAEKLLDEMPVF